MGLNHQDKDQEKQLSKLYSHPRGPQKAYLLFLLLSVRNGDAPIRAHQAARCDNPLSTALQTPQQAHFHSAEHKTLTCLTIIPASLIILFNDMVGGNIPLLLGGVSIFASSVRFLTSLAPLLNLIDGRAIPAAL